MVLKFLTAGLISALLAAVAMYLVIDDDMVETMKSRPAPIPSAQPDDETASDNSGMIERALGRDYRPESRIGRPVETLPDDQKKSWLDDVLARDEDVPTVSGNGTDPAVFGVLIDQASRIEIVDARDDAYFNILAHALAEDRPIVADSLLERFSTPELRDTARQRIGISHAQAGRIEEAFAVLETIEIEQLRDPIRLEIIRAATAPPG